MRHVEAVLLRIRGMLYHDIAKHLGYRTTQGAQAAVTAGLAKVQLESTEGARKLDVLRCESYLEALQSQIAEGKTKAISTALAALRRRGALLGLDPSLNAPAAVVVNLIKIGDGRPKPMKELSDSELGVAIDYAHSRDLRFLPTVEVSGESVVNINPDEDIEEEEPND
jgi:hypothetical protein